MSGCARCGGKDHATSEHDAATAETIFHLENSYLQVLDDGLYIHAEDDHYSGKLEADDALALARSILAIVKV